MDIHEYQAKDILSKFGVDIAPGALAYSPEQATYRARELGGEKWVVKAQVHAGGRGKAGGVKLCSNEREIQEACENMFGRTLVTHQTGPQGKGIYRVYVEAAVPIAREIYLGLVLDRSTQRVMIVASGEGGMEIEDISMEKPESIVRSTVEPAVGLQKDPIQQLSRKERAILEALSKGLTNRELSAELNVSINTVKFHLSNLFDKLSVRNRAQAIAYYYSNRHPNDDL